MKRVFVLLAIMLHGVSNAAADNLSQEHRKLLEESSSFLATTQLPPAIVRLSADSNGRLAPPGGEWESSCVIDDAALPRKRLIWAAVSGNYYVVHYEAGGIAYSAHILLVEMTRGEARIVWHALTRDPFRNYAEFLSGLRNGVLNDVKLRY